MSLFLGNKKRDLSDKLRDEEDSNNVKENDSLSSLPQQRPFSSFNSPELAKLLVNCLKSIENQVKELLTFHEETKENQIKVTESLEFMSVKLGNLEKQVTKKDEKINQFEKTIGNLVKKPKSLSSDIDSLEQYSRRNCLVLHH